MTGMIVNTGMSLPHNAVIPNAVVLFRDDDDDNGVVLVHQSQWQQRMTQLYGTHMCLIDATYNTTVYGMPLMFLCVPTNVGFVNVATLLLADERRESIEAALWKIVEWNPDWKPSEFLSDFHEGQIAALESVFSGTLTVVYILHCEFLLCVFTSRLSNLYTHWRICIICFEDSGFVHN